MELGRHVKRGEKAITLCQPVTVKRKVDDGGDDDETRTWFVFRSRWFVLAQTDGQDLPPMEIPDWDGARALAALIVTEVPFDAPNGNVMGYARKREIAISPLNPLPHKTRFHELGHFCSATRPRAIKPTTGRSPRDPCARPRPKPSRCCVARPSGCRARISAEAISSLGGASGTPFPRPRLGGYCGSPIRSSRLGSLNPREGGHDGRSLRSRLHDRSNVRQPVDRTPPEL
jgi:hypothetical protein